VCSSANVVIRSVRCRGSHAVVARSFYVLEAHVPERSKGPAILCLAGLAKVIRIKLRPGEGLRVNQGHVLGATGNIDHLSEPIAISHISESSFSKAFQLRRRRRKEHDMPPDDDAAAAPASMPLREGLKRARHGSRILWN